ncbi:DUF3667 domain-containing protein [soil metagenome]
MTGEDTASDTGPATVVAPPADGQARCGNCGTALQGDFCHQCGQSRHNPTRSLGHAIEDVFESVWHLDGRIFRTVRDLMVPARVALEYLAGHRVRYIAPFRLFVILSVLTFFVANLTADVDPKTAIQISGASGISGADSVAEVELRRDATIARLQSGQRARRDDSTATAAALSAGVAAVEREAAARIAELEGGDGATRTTASPVAAAGPIDANDVVAWDAQAHAVQLSWLPDRANAWLTTQSDRMSRNVLRIRDDPAAFVHALIGAVPTSLFLLVPVFALMLKCAYLFKRRLYLEHLVVALYSHAFLLLALLALVLSMALRDSLADGERWLAATLRWLEVALWAWMPLYLLLMQKRVYAQGWPMTLLKYGVVGTLYLMLLGFGAAFVVLYVLVRM